MREIKFRAWDDKTKVMSFDESMGDVLCEKEYDKPHLILMQFTGLKDKKGKEIYEGDIIKVKDHPDFSALGEIGFVFWDNEEQSYFYGVKDGWSDLLCTPETKQLEVIGNIYENPELIKEEAQEDE